MQSPLPFDFITAQFSTDSSGVNYAYDEFNDKLYIQTSAGDWVEAPSTAPVDSAPKVTVTGTGNTQSKFPWLLVAAGIALAMIS